MHHGRRGYAHDANNVNALRCQTASFCASIQAFKSFRSMSRRFPSLRAGSFLSQINERIYQTNCDIPFPEATTTLRTGFSLPFLGFLPFHPGAMLPQRPTRPIRFLRTKMHSQQLQIRVLFGVVVAMALIGLALLRSELQTLSSPLKRTKKRGRVLKFLSSKSGKGRFRKAS